MLPDLLVDGEFEPFSSGEDVFGFWRRGEDERVCVLVNASLSDAHTVKVPVGDKQVVDVVSGVTPRVSHGQAEVFLWPLGTAVLHFHRERRLQEPLERGMGVLCHITSVPNGGWPGTLGAPARRFVDWLAAAGQKYWQVLPVNPTDRFGSPYANLGAFAGNLGLLELPAPAALARLERIGNDSDYLRFCDENDYWLTPYATFRACKELLGEKPWQEWPEPYRTYSPRLAADPRLRHAIEAHRRLQFEFQREWDDLLDYAHARGVKIIGDMPMFVSADSADVWSEPDIFDLDERGYARREAGAPGDAFAPDGQNWGNPVFRWDILREQNYGWWLRRCSRMLALYDVVRLDHFIGFMSYFGIPAGRTAREARMPSARARSSSARPSASLARCPSSPRTSAPSRRRFARSWRLRASRAWTWRSSPTTTCGRATCRAPRPWPTRGRTTTRRWWGSARVATASGARRRSRPPTASCAAC